MTLDQTASLLIGALSGASVFAIQTTGTPAVTPFMGLLAPAFSAVIGAVMGYAVLHTTVKTVERDIHMVRKDLAINFELLRNLSDRIARIEGRLDAQ
jgi:uncharacterized membrane protein